MTTRSARPRSSAGPETVGPVTQKMVGTTPEQATNSRAAVPQPWTAATPSSMAAPLDSTKQIRGRRWSRAVRAAIARFSPSAGRSAPRSSPAISTTMALRPPSSRTAKATDPPVRLRSSRSGTPFTRPA